LRRLHALAGAVALGGFLVEHVLVNAVALRGEASWSALLAWLGGSRFLAVFEALFVLAPLAFHIGYGIVRAREPTTPSSRRQRISGIFVFVFLALHLGELRFARLFSGLEPAALGTVLVSHLSRTSAGVPLVALGYIAGLFATCFHFANGARTAAGAFGFSEHRIGRAAIALASILFVVGTASVVAVATGSRLLPPSDDTTRPCGPSR
jgi:succinate dehydrogenase/fumarate reductase cytochrome b subunit (b558 family)